MTSRNIALLLFAVLLLCPGREVKAQESRLIKNGLSPSGEFSITTPDDSISNKSVHLQFRQNSAVLARVALIGEESGDTAEALWNSNSTLVAVNMVISYRGSKAFVVYSAVPGHIDIVTLPDFLQNILGRFGSIQAGPHGESFAVRWLAENQLQVKAIGEADLPSKERRQFDCDIQISVFPRTNITQPVSILRSIECKEL